MVRKDCDALKADGGASSRARGSPFERMERTFPATDLRLDVHDDRSGGPNLRDGGERRNTWARRTMVGVAGRGLATSSRAPQKAQKK